jgi:hypothetical protein
MRHKIIIYFFITVLSASTDATAFKITTVRDGSWFNDSTWDAMQVPAAGDTVIINHFVTAENLDIEAGESVLINLQGTVCCNDVIHMFCNSFLTIKGRLRVRYFDVEGIIEHSGDLNFRDSAKLHNCAYMHSTGSINIGNYDCTDPASDTITIYPPSPLTDTTYYDYDFNFSVNPSPFTDNFFIKFSIPESQQVVIESFDLNGKKIQTLINDYFEEGEFSGNVNSIKDLPPAIYIVRMTCRQKTFNRKVVHL